MNLDWYYTFVILAKTLNYRLASEEINLTIPSIHKQIKNLEQHLNVKLFETYKNQIILTEDGHTFLPIAQSFIEQYESGIKHIQLKKTMFQSKLNVVVSSYIATFIMPKFLKSFLTSIRLSMFLSMSKMKILKKILIIIRMTSGLAEINLN